MSVHRRRLIYLLHRATHRLKTETDAAFMEAAHITTAQATAMEIIIQSGPMSQRALADALAQRESATTAMVERLLKAGYVSRHRDETDRRTWMLEATETGRAARERLKMPLKRINAELDEAFKDVDIAALADGLEQVIDRFSGR